MTTASANKYRTHAIAAMVLILAPLLVFAPSLRHEFILVWDDSTYVLSNSAAHGFSPLHLKTAFTSSLCGNYAPLHTVSYMLDYTFWGLNPAGYILHNILLHIASGLLLYALLIRCAFTRLTALAAAFIFLLHPVQVESVVWVAQRKNLLAMFFFLASFHCYLDYRRRETQSGRTTGYGLSLFGFLCALLSKSAAIILPLALLAYDLGYAPRTRIRQSLADKIPYLFLAGIAALIALNSHQEGNWGGRTGYHGGSPLATFHTMLPVLGRYVRNLAWPTDLSAFYQVRIRQAADAESLAWLIIICGLIGLGIRLYRRQRPLFFWYALFFLGLTPVSQIIPIVTMMNDRYLYFPMLGAAPFVCCCAATLLRRCHTRPARLVLGLLLALSLAALPLLSISRARVWQSPLTLWEDTVAKAPGLILFHHHLAEEYYRRGEYGKLVATCRETLARWPDDQKSLELAGTTLTQQGDVMAGRIYLETLARRHPEDLDGMLELAENYRKSDETGKALAACRAVLAQNPASERAQSCMDRIAAGMPRRNESPAGP